MVVHLGPAKLRNRNRNAPRPEWKMAPAYLKWLRDRECYLDGRGCGWGVEFRRASFIEAAHVDGAGGKGVSCKVADAFAIPLCQLHHDEQHGKVGPFKERGGWKTFQAKYGFDAVEVADAYWKSWRGKAKWEVDRG